MTAKHDESSLILEEGKCYRTRGGHKAKVLDLSFVSVAYPVYVMHIDEDGKYTEEHTADGRFYDNGEDSDYDLVAEWKDPTTKTVQVFLYRNRSGELVTRLSNQFAAREDELIASNTITLTEGEFK